jgi:hypothetical protein
VPVLRCQRGMANCPSLARHAEDQDGSRRGNRQPAVGELEDANEVDEKDVCPRTPEEALSWPNPATRSESRAGEHLAEQSSWGVVRAPRCELLRNSSGLRSQ